jgi:hypothetical protein
VGLAGVWRDDGLPPPVVAYGPRFRNHVEYVGWTEKSILRRYRSSAAFGRAVRKGDFDYLVVGRGRDPLAPGAREERYAEAAGYRLVEQSDFLSLYKRS